MKPIICCNSQCSELATKRVFWPGHEPKPMCEDHTTKAVAIADHMGFYLYVEAITGFADPLDSAEPGSLI
jgi:hypothetical protein